MFQESVCHEIKPEMEPIKEESESPHASPTSRVPTATTCSEVNQSTGSNVTNQSTVSRSQEVSYSSSNTTETKLDNKTDVADEKLKTVDDKT